PPAPAGFVVHPGSLSFFGHRWSSFRVLEGEYGRQNRVPSGEMHMGIAHLRAVREKRGPAESVPTGPLIYVDQGCGRTMPAVGKVVFKRTLCRTTHVGTSEGFPQLAGSLSFC